MKKRNRKGEYEIDSLIVVMVPYHPRYDATSTHQGAAGEEKKTVKNMMKDDREIYDMAKRDIDMLQKLRDKGSFERFKNSVVYPWVIFPGAPEGENSLDAAIKYMEKVGCAKDKIKNLGVNITAHGNPETIGSRHDISLSPDDETTGLATLVYDYLFGKVSGNTELSFYMLSCNSAYVDYDEPVDLDEAKEKVLNESYAGRFHGAIAREAQEDEAEIKFNVSGFRGFIGRTNKNKMTVSSRRGNDGDANFIGIDRVRFIISNINGGAEVALPENFKFEVFDVQRSMTANEAIDAKIGIFQQLENANSLPQESDVDNDNLSESSDIESDVFDKKPDEKLDEKLDEADGERSPAKFCRSLSAGRFSQISSQVSSGRSGSC